MLRAELPELKRTSVEIADFLRSSIGRENTRLSVIKKL